MLRKFRNLFGSNKNINNDVDMDDIINITNIMDDIANIVNDIDDEICMDNCSHDWLEYDSIKLNNTAKENQKKVENQTLRILNKSLHEPLNDLDSKMFKLLTEWYPTLKMPGKCVVCDKNLIVIYMSDNNHGVMY